MVVEPLLGGPVGSWVGSSVWRIRGIGQCNMTFAVRGIVYGSIDGKLIDCFADIFGRFCKGQTTQDIQDKGNKYQKGNRVGSQFHNVWNVVRNLNEADASKPTSPLFLSCSFHFVHGLFSRTAKNPCSHDVKKVKDLTAQTHKGEEIQKNISVWTAWWNRAAPGTMENLLHNLLQLFSGCYTIQGRKWD